MGLQISTNVMAIDAQRNLGISSTAFGKSVQKLSSGLRINSAADDAAGLAISEKLRSQVNGLNQAVRNSQDGISLIQTAEGALNETTSILQRMRELAVQAANDTLSASDRGQVQAEVTALMDEVTRISTSTQFNGANLIDGSYSATGFAFQVGANANQSITVTIGNMGAAALSVSALVVTTQSDANATITTIDAAIALVSSQRSSLGAVQNRLEHTIANLSVASENLSASESRIRDTDMAAETANYTRYQIMQQAGISVLAQANQAPAMVLKLLQ